MGARLQSFLSAASRGRATLSEDFDFTYVQELVSSSPGTARWRLGLMEMPGAGQGGHFARAEPTVAQRHPSMMGEWDHTYSSHAYTPALALHSNDVTW